jgi:hypothetical protein
MSEDTNVGPFTIQPHSRLRGDLSIYIEDMAERDLEAATLKDQPAGKSAGLIVVHIAGHGGDRRKSLQAPNHFFAANIAGMQNLLDPDKMALDGGIVQTMRIGNDSNAERPAPDQPGAAAPAEC